MWRCAFGGRQSASACSCIEALLCRYRDVLGAETESLPMSLERQSDLMRQSATSDTLGRYYTSTSVSGVLVDAVNGIRPKVVLELGAGHGSITTAAARKWSNAQLVTVDTDLDATPTVRGVGQDTAHTHHVHDALDDALADRIGLSLGSVDVGLCNPPYVRPRWRASFGRILEDAGFSGALKSIHDAGADLLFIAQNLRLLKRRGKLGLVLPDGLIAGEKFQGVRSVLLREHSVEQVIQLPRRVFSRTEAQTYLVVLSKQAGETESVALRAMNVDGSLSEPVYVAQDQACRRLDYGFHAFGVSRQRPPRSPSKLLLGDVAEELFRGSLNSNELRSLGLPVFHLGDFPDAVLNQPPPSVPTSFIHSKRNLSILRSNIRIAEAGDILMARIGRNLHEKICVVRRGACIVSDCIFVLRVAPTHHAAVLSFLVSKTGRSAIEAAAHGVGAKYLSRSDLLELVIPL
ncbi:N-6 DNA methylase [Ralstonia solanacearum]|nr:N-6 DNA methylase [Ralstonia solanacearum]NKF97792.1 N-6 DNA methylase [Ralstonia solanacearum]NKG13216.1 N-6 DNA methylase [Ralstonia solanacearum]